MTNVQTGTADFQSTVSDLYAFELSAGADAAVVNLTDGGLTRFVVKAAINTTTHLSFPRPITSRVGGWFVDLQSGTTPQMSIEGNLGSRVFPMEISGFAAWFDFSDIATLWQDTARTSAITADGQTIKGVTDKSGNGHHLSHTVGATFKSNIIKGQSVSRFVGAANGRLYTGAFTLTQPWTIFIVGNTTAFAAAQNFCDGNASFSSCIEVSNSTQVAIYTTLGVAQAVTANLLLSPTVTGAVFNGASAKNIVNGVTTTGDCGPTNITLLTLGGCFNVTTQSLTGDIAECLVYTGALSAANITAVTRYLGSKWGITVA